MSYAAANESFIGETVQNDITTVIGFTDPYFFVRQFVNRQNIKGEINIVPL
jgi:hypothetical protein